jgi:uncharacterized membrane protein YecN with MAPEG domain
MNPAPMPAITALYAALVALLLIVLGLRVVGLRRRLRVGLGDGGQGPLQQAVRVHGNAVEWALPVLMLMLVAELNRASPLLLHAAGIALLVGRFLHAAGLGRSSGGSPGRVLGMVVTIAALTTLAVFDLVAFLRTLLL